MRDIPEQRIDQKAVKYWRLTGIISSVFYWVLPIAYYVATLIWDWPKWVLIPMVVVALALSLFTVISVPLIRWKTWRYDVSTDEIDLYYGVLVKHRMLIPMVRVQHVDTEQGPLMRRYGISTVTISTAADEHNIPALTDNVADELRDKIAELARVVEEDV